MGFVLHTFLLSDMGISDILHFFKDNVILIVNCFTDCTDMVLELVFIGKNKKNNKNHDNI